MRSLLTFALTLALFGCGSAAEIGEGPSPGAGGGSGGSGGSGGGGVKPKVLPTQLVPGGVGLVAVTSDGYAVFRDAEALAAVKLESGAVPMKILDKPGTVTISRSVVFNWSDIDWTTNLGDLSIWSAAGGTQHIGTSIYAETMVSASEDGSFFVYTNDVTATTVDLVVAPNDLSAPETLIDSMGRGSEQTCPPSLGFVGQRLFVGWCAVGSRAATLERFEWVDGKWVRTAIASDALATWSADATGERVFYQSSAYQGFYAEGGTSTLIDASVNGGVMLPDGSAVLYNVSDQLRRTSLPQVRPIPVVTRGFAQRAEFSPEFDYVLYSTTVTYVNGTKRDLFVSKTGEFNPQPVELITEPVASLGRSAFTRDAKYVLYFSDVTPNGSTLNIRPVDGGEPITLPNVYEVVAANDDNIVFTDNRSDPEKYPVVADLKLMAVGSGAEPELLEAKVMDGRSFYLDPSRQFLVYLRSGLDRDRTAPDHDGMFFRSL